MDKARQVEGMQAAQQADLERRSALLADKLRKEELEIQATLISRKVGCIHLSVLLVLTHLTVISSV